MEDLNIGKKIRAIRLYKDLSMRKLAEKAGITPSMLSQIENDQANPSINTLRSIANALDTTLYAFFSEQIPDPPSVVHISSRKTIGVNSDTEVHYALLTAEKSEYIEFMMMHIPPKTVTYKVPESHFGEEVAYMLSGKSVILEIEGVQYKIKPGDSIKIPARARHVWRNMEDEKVEVIFAIAPPSF